MVESIKMIAYASSHALITVTLSKKLIFISNQGVNFKTVFNYVKVRMLQWIFGKVLHLNW